MKFFGNIHSISDVKVVGEKKFEFREMVVTSNEQYPQSCIFQFGGEKHKLLEGLSPGQAVEIDYNLNGRLYTNKEGAEACINTLAGWKITKK